ncbi:NAD(P)-dependent oxidoreductase [Megasphaera vaginalis (ex Srinivasan et al. 2021)]|uniref:NADP oxidoreductase coenzyme F420-dependent n=1 Tax=Megasphaera vaginalis (ex Srinivasan et al. 2021) TaxID=1111454 RepID=U7UCY3_9FIRM|nr:NAD(P)-dependent oxidoreductase [Megasphaera vaginalis (ex Srinivasan et al. 2021)]ERT57205.1 NADP oxidoreductase coenzyme F420-dependent [Megasphaera vaginalis (ex Srinivasan et al. 2021)]
MKTIGFIGVGIMGKPMVRNLLKAGFSVRIYARTKEKAAALLTAGAAFFPTIGECVNDCDLVMTMVGFPADVEEVYYGAGNIFDAAAPGTYLVDCTTTSPTLAERLYRDGKAKGFHVLDVPVTGGESGAIAGTLSLLAGGEKGDFETLLPVFRAVGKTITYLGKAGSGQHGKLANQILIAGALSGVCEALTYGNAQGLDPAVLLGAISGGAGGSAQLSSLGPKILAHDYAPGFYMKHIIKDFKLAQEESEKKGISLDILQKALENFEELAAAGYENEGTQALIRH